MRTVLIFSGILCLLTACRKQARVDYAVIENGLMPAVLVEDSNAVTYSVEERMRYFKVPGASIAVFRNGEIVWSKAYGLRESGTENRVTSETMFQAASISKAVTGLGVLKLAEDHALDLDADINNFLKSWKLESAFTEKEKVTIRRLLTHTAGTNISGVMGYEKQAELPATTADILNGKGDTPALKLDTVPGAAFSYSGGGFVILQQLVEDVSGLNFKDYFKQVVFQPLGMTYSTFDQFPEGNVSAGHNWDGDPYPGGWRVFPEMAAAGLWTTPADLAKFCFAIEDAYYGEQGAFISQELAKEMLTPLKKRGLGVAVDSTKGEFFFFHGGSNPGGFRDFMVDAFERRTGIIIMTNADQGRMLHDDVLRSFSDFFEIDIKSPRPIQPLLVETEKLKKFTGKYQLHEEMPFPLEVSINSKAQLILYDPNDGMKSTYQPLSDTSFVNLDDGSEINFQTDPGTGKVETLDYMGIYTFYKTG